MKKPIIISLIIAVCIIALTSAACPDCVENIDITDKKSVLTCVITVVFGLVVRYIEKKKLKKHQKENNKNEKN